MKLRFDQQVHFAEDLDRLEPSQKRTDRQITNLTDSQNVIQKALTGVVGTVAELAESQEVTEAAVAALARRIDVYIAAQANGHQPPP